MSSLSDKRLKGNELVVKDLAFMQSAYCLDLVELRIIAMAIIVLRQDNDRAEFDANVPVELHANMYADLFCTTRNNAYKVLEDAAKSLRERRIKWVDIYEDKRTNKTAKRLNDLSWTTMCSYVKDAAFVQIYFSPQIIPFLIHLDANFAGYEIRNLVKLTTPYELRLYELGVAWKKKGVATFKKETLRERLGIFDESQFKTASNFNRMLNKALNTINKETDLTINITPNYATNNGSKGRVVSTYTMTVKVNRIAGRPTGESMPPEDGDVDDVGQDSQVDMKTVNPKDEDDFLSKLGSNSGLRNFGASAEDAEYTEVKPDEKTVQAEPDQPVIKKRAIRQPSIPAALANGDGIIITPDENGEWDIEKIIKYLDSPKMQIVGMDEDHIPVELLKATPDYKKYANKVKDDVALAYASAKVRRKIAKTMKRGSVKPSHSSNGASRVKTHNYTHLTEVQRKQVMNNAEFRSRYAPQGQDNPFVINNYLDGLLQGDLSRIPDLDEYLSFNTTR